MRAIILPVVILLAGGVLLYLLAATSLFIFQGRLLFLPSRQVWRTPSSLGLPHEEVFLTTSDRVRIHGWFVPTREARGTVLFFHGNAGNISHRLELLAQLHRWRFNVFAIDYRGYGNSSGKPSENGIYRDAEAAWAFLVERKRIAPGAIVIFGRSLGAAVAAHLGARKQPGGVVLNSAFTSLPDIAAHLYRWFPVRLLLRHRFPTLQNVTRIRCPVLIAHSRQDDLIPFEHGEQLFATANEPKYFLEMKGGHDDCVTATGLPYEEAIRSFLYRTLGTTLPHL